jgi:hypothetical protein
MTVIGYPSRDFPPSPRFTLTIPDDWQAAWPEGTLLAVHGPPGEEGIVPNVVVAHERLYAGISLDDVVERTIEGLGRSDPTIEVDAPRVLAIEGAIAAVLVGGTSTGDGGKPILQRQIIIQVDSVSNGTAILEITATFGASQTQLLEGIVATATFKADTDDPSMLPEATQEG